MTPSKSTKGSLEVICGSMFSGKTAELIRRITRAQYAHQTTMIFKHCLDDRKTLEYLHAHNGQRLKAIALENPNEILELVLEDVDVIGIDEIQFFNSKIVSVVQDIMDQAKRVIVAGLDLDFRGHPFASMPALLSIADSITKLHAVCTCGKDAHYSQRIINGDPASSSDPVIMPGAEEYYQARCRDCFKIDKKPRFRITITS